MQRYPVRNLLGQLQTTPFTQAQRQHLPCPALPPAGSLPKTCARTADGGVICEDGTYYPSYCAAPPVTEPDLAPYVRQGDFMVPQIPVPAPRSLTEVTGDKFPVLPLVIALVSLVGTVIFS